jgi:hypothetical protein
MEMRIVISSRHILIGLIVICWMIFIGLLMDAGIIISNAVFALFINSKNAGYMGLGSVFKANESYFIILTTLMSIVAVLKALLFYLIVHFFHKKKLDFARPFNAELGKFISNISYLALGIGLFSYWGQNHSKGLRDQGLTLPEVQELKIGGADVWIFMGVTLLVIAQIIKKGIEIQSENELTV